MHQPRCAGFLVVALSLIVSCSKGPSIDWSAPENFFAVEKAAETDDGVRLEFHSLVDAPAAKVYQALADIEHYATFVDGVTESVLTKAENNTKVIQITHDRLTPAQVEYISSWQAGT